MVRKRERTADDLVVCISTFHEGAGTDLDGAVVYLRSDPGVKAQPSHFVPLLWTTAERDEQRLQVNQAAGVYG
jgi:hypothetical protein